MPYLLGASDSVRAGVDGLRAPDLARDASYVGIEPMTGQILDFHVGAAIAIALEPTTVRDLLSGQDVTYFPNVTSVVIPVGTGMQIASPTPAQANLFRSQVYAGVYVAVALRWGGVAAAVAAAAAAACCALRARRQHRGGLGGSWHPEACSGGNAPLLEAAPVSEGALQRGRLS